MSEITRGVIGMPYELAMSSELSRRQFHSRAQALLDDHDRIVSALTAERNEADRRAGAAERHMAELKDSAFRRENWLRKAKEEAGYSASETFDRVWAETLGKANECDTLRAEVERLQRELATAHADASHYASTAEDLRAEVERLKEHEPHLEDVERLVKALSFLGVSTPESMEESCIRWLSLVRALIRTAEDSKMLRQDSERLAEVERLHARVAAAAECLAGWHRHEAVPRTAVDKALKILDTRESPSAESEVEQLRKDAALFRRLRDLPDELLGAPGVPCVAIPEGPRAGRYVSGPDLDAALEAAR